MTPPRAGPETAFQAYLDKWLQAEPEARLLRLFVPAAREPRFEALLVLLHELESAAFDLDPRPAEAKLAWWDEELRHWQRGSARHPVTRTLPSADDRASTALLALPAAAAGWLALDAVATFSEWQAPLDRFAQFQHAAIDALSTGQGTSPDSGGASAIGPSARALRRFARLAADPRGLLPLDMLAQSGASRADVAAAPHGAAAAAVVSALARRVDESSAATPAGTALSSARDFLARDLLRRLAADHAAQRGPGVRTVLGLWRLQRRRR